MVFYQVSRGKRGSVELSQDREAARLGAQLNQGVWRVVVQTRIRFYIPDVYQVLRTTHCSPPHQTGPSVHRNNGLPVSSAWRLNAFPFQSNFHSKTEAP